MSKPKDNTQTQTLAPVLRRRFPVDSLSCALDVFVCYEQATAVHHINFVRMHFNREEPRAFVTGLSSWFGVGFWVKPVDTRNM